VHGVFACDGAASGDLLSPRHYREFVAPYTKKLDEAVKALGLAHIQHVCGDTTRNLETVGEIRPDAYSFDYTVDIGVAKASIGHLTCLIGNIDPSEVLLFGKPGQVREVTEQCIAQGAPGGGFAVGSGCDVCLKTPLENLMTMIDACRQATY
jgi:uroporphyrinogen decarboxylase